MSKLWEDAEVVPAPPMKERPRCWACGRRIKPNYKTEHELRYHDRKTGARVHPKGDEPVYTGTTSCESRVSQRIWQGTYGWADTFCGLNCAANWAIVFAQAAQGNGCTWTTQTAKNRIAEEEGHGDTEG